MKRYLSQLAYAIVAAPITFALCHLMSWLCVAMAYVFPVVIVAAGVLGLLEVSFENGRLNAKARWTK